jgi:hypothetical protein
VGVTYLDPFVNTSFTATFDQSVGAKTVLVHVQNKRCTLEIPTGTTSDGGGAAIASGATDIPAAYRPRANISFPVIVTSNNALVAGKLIVLSTGQLSFTASAASGTFTDNAVAGFDRCSVSYILA